MKSCKLAFWLSLRDWQTSYPQCQERRKTTAVLINHSEKGFACNCRFFRGWWFAGYLINKNIRTRLAHVQQQNFQATSSTRCCCHVWKCCGDKCKSNAAHTSSNDSAWSNQPHAFLQLSERPWTTRNWHGPATGQHDHALSAHWVNYIPGATTPREMSKANTSCCNFLSLFVWMSGFKTKLLPL